MSDPDAVRGTLRRGAVVYRRCWSTWMRDGRRCPYLTGRVIEDLGSEVRVEVFGKGHGRNRTAVWPKEPLRRGKPGVGPHWRSYLH